MHHSELSYPDSETNVQENRSGLNDQPSKSTRNSKRRILIVFVVLLVGGLLFFSEYRDRKSLQAAARQGEQLKRNVKFQDIALSNLSGWSKISGRVENDSPYTLTGADVTVTIQDCVQNSCETVGQNSITMNDLSVPAQQARSFERYLTFKGLPAPRGQYKWRFDVEDLRGY
jgi:hypothetical protein